MHVSFATYQWGSTDPQHITKRKQNKIKKGQQTLSNLKISEEDLKTKDAPKTNLGTDI